MLLESRFLAESEITSLAAVRFDACEEGEFVGDVFSGKLSQSVCPYLYACFRAQFETFVG